jgi:phosphoribosylamine---glycine ligase
LRFLGIGDAAGLGDMYLRLVAQSHEVKVHIADEGCRDTFKGLVERTDDWQAELAWIRQAGRDGIVIFETADRGEIQDRLRRDGFNVIGGSAFGDRLENDRAFGQERMRAAGFPTATTHGFSSFEAGIALVQQRPRRYVFKLNGGFASTRNYVGELEDGRDIAALLAHLGATWRFPDEPDFILMDHVAGVEVGVGGYFNGEAFLDAVVIDWEHKRFFDGEIGELTGEMGTLLSYRNSRPLFEATLARMTEQLRSGGYVGYINLNTIVNEDGIWPLEFTCRFGYPGYAICEALHEEGWDALFARMVARDRLDFRTAEGFAVGVQLTVPPYPRSDRYEELSKGLPILFRSPPSETDRRHMHLGEVEIRDGQMLASGETGLLMTVTGVGDTVKAARARAYTLARNIVVPNMRYRTDIGARFIAHDCGALQALGLWPREGERE